MRDTGATDRVRRFAADHYIAPARRRKETIVKIPSGGSAKLMQERHILPPNRYPIVCDALRSRKFLEDNQIRLIEEQAPPTVKRNSSTITFVYDLSPGALATTTVPPTVTFSDLRGVLKQTYAKLGGAAKHHLAERKSWDR